MALDRSNTVVAGTRQGERGSSTVEFAFIAPILVALLFGTVEISNLLAQNRKVALAAQTMTDMVSRMKTVTSADRTTLANAIDLVLRPYNTNYTATVAYVAFNGATPPQADLGAGSKTFQFAVKGGYLFPNTSMTNIACPASSCLGVGNDAVIIGQVTSNYVPILIVGFMGSNLQLTSTSTERPRETSGITSSVSQLP